MSADFYAGRINGNVWGPIGKTFDPSLNLSNGNARMVLKALGLDPDFESDGLYPINDVIGRCVAWIDLQGSELAPGRRQVTDRNVVHCGTPDGYLDAKIERILMIAEDGSRRGATHLIVG